MLKFDFCHCPLIVFSVIAGTSLLQEVVYLVSQGADPDEIGLMNIDEQLPVLEYPQPGLDIIQVEWVTDITVADTQHHNQFRTEAAGEIKLFNLVKQCKI